MIRFTPVFLRRSLLVVGLAGGGTGVQALTLAFPGPAVQTQTLQEPLARYRFATGPWAAGVLPSRVVEGAMEQTAWRIEGAGQSTLALLADLRGQIAAAGWQIRFECDAAECGGYDFRYEMELFNEPDMHVDLGDYRYLLAEKSDDVMALMVSRALGAGFVQMVRVGGDLPAVEAETAPPMAQVTPKGDLAAQLENGGATVLEDLVFASSASELAAGDYASLAALAQYLRAHPDRAITLVGHTDASGSLAVNVALSRQRAESVRARLIGEFDIPAAQLQADGVGYLAPRAGNLTPEGRTRNRRVEAMLTATQ